MRITVLIMSVCLCLSLPGTSRVLGQANWPRFRGADGSGVAPNDPDLPERWSRSENVVWRRKIPGWGCGSPIVWGDRVFVTAVTSDDDYEQPQAGLYLGGGRGEPPDTVHHWIVYCLHLDTGQLLWQREAYVGKPQMPRHPKSSYAAETPVTDGQRLYVLFGDLGLYCYDLDGQLLWSQRIDPAPTLFGYGAAASPVVQGDQVIVVYDNDQQSYIAAYDGATGMLRWKQPRDERSTWATPLVWNNDFGCEIVVPGKNENRAYSPAGELLWHFDGRMSDLIIPSPFVAGRLLYITSGYYRDNKRPVFAIRPGARGDITLADGQSANRAIRWSLEKMGPYVTSPIVYRGLYFTLLDRGMITCHDAVTGDLVYNRKRFPRGATFTASPWAYNGSVFFLAEDGETYVMPAGRKFKIKHTNALGELCLATPSMCRGKLLIRTASQVYCFAAR